MTTVPATGVHLPARPARERRALLGALTRLAAFAPLLLLALGTWAELVAPAAGGSARAMTLAATALGGLLIAAARIERRARRNAVLAGVGPLLLAAAILAAGIPARLLLPAGWDELLAGVANGIDAMPVITVPYRGPDAWVRQTLLLGGTLLAAIAALQAFWPRARDEVPGSAAAAAFSIGIIYAVPVIERTPERPFLSGALLAVLLGAFLFADRMRADQALGAALLLGLTTLVAAAVAPALDRERPWFDYERFGRELAARGTVSYRWDHRYGPLDWPREGAEMARVRAQAPAYWKTQVLDGFDGRVWRSSGRVPPFEPEGDLDTSQPQWFQTIEVEIRNLRSRQFLTAGTALRIGGSRRRAVIRAGGTFETGRGTLRKGTAYRAEVYTPRPSPSQLGGAGTDYGSVAAPWLRVRLPDSDVAVPARAAGAAAEVTFPPFGSGLGPVAELPGTGIVRYDGQAEALVEGSSLARVFALARRLRARAATPYAFVRAVRERVRRGATYSETPGTHDHPLDAFLFDERAGYCQHFSGAMALLLRMGGVPARVAVGFSPGRLDRDDGEYVVSDFDAHSWVEAYFPRYGWVTFDPTPAAAPAREQVADRRQALGVRRGRDPGGDRASDPLAGGPGDPTGADGGGRPGMLAGAAAALAALVAAVVALVRRRRRAVGGDPDLAELERALRRTGRALPPEATLEALAERLGAEGEAAGYLRALSARRFGTGGPRPTPAQRRALRRLLGAGLGPRGGVRAWWALPPRPFRPS